MTVIMERFPYRYIQDGVIELNGKPDYRIQKFNEYTRRYNDMYYLDNAMQLDACLEDVESVSYTHLTLPTILLV